MDAATLKRLLESLQQGQIGVDETLRSLVELPFKDLGFARVDTHRQLRTGFPEVVFGMGKTVDQLTQLGQVLLDGGSAVLMTRVDARSAAEVRHTLSALDYDAEARCLFREASTLTALTSAAPVFVLTAGTLDLPVAAEAALTARLFGCAVERFNDVGVAGLHRLLAIREQLDRAAALVVVAGMEGALPSVVAGLCRRPVIAVPTSVGYGAALGGITPLLSMLTSCAAGVSVVNIDNGFGAGYSAALIARGHTEVVR